MGMPITVEIVDAGADQESLDVIFEYFTYIDNKFSTYKKESEISQINMGLINEEKYSKEMQEVFALSEKTKRETDDYFDIKKPNGLFDPSGLVKGWAIHNASNILKEKGYKNFYIEAGGDIETFGKNKEGKPWTIGIRNPFNTDELIKILEVENKGVATSGNYIRGNHIYDPLNKKDAVADIVSLTVIGPNIYEADRFATAAFAMGENGIFFIENLPGFEGYVVDKNGTATMTQGFKNYQKINA